MNDSVRKAAIVWIGAVAFGTASGALGAALVISSAPFSIPSALITRLPVAAPSQDAEVINVVDRVLPSVVSIDIVQTLDEQETFRSGFPIGPVSVGGGTGFFISEDGLVVTNRHVISEPDAEYVVVTQDGKKYSASVLAMDPAMDLGVLKVDSSTSSTRDGSQEEVKFPALELGDSDALKPGQTVIAIGNALAEFQNSVTKGIISGLNRSLFAGDFGREELIEEAIQTDAAINPGNSGGPLLSLDGKVVGMNTAISDGAQSLGFALPSNALYRAVESVRKYGRIVRPWIGVRYILVDEDVANEEGLSKDYGALIQGDGQDSSGIMPDSPAKKAGLQEGDQILEINGETVGMPRSLATIVGRMLPGEAVELRILRDGNEIQIPLVLDERPQEP
jgi:S1-C subfamily serine protease